jgi:hypothetical protein
MNSPDGSLLGPFFPEDDLPLRSFVSIVRAFMRDYPELNRLIQGVEHSDRMIAWAILDALNDFNTTPPLTSFPLKTFPSKHILLRGTAISLLESLGMLMTRNQLTFSDGGIQVGISDKSGLLMSWITLFTNKYEEKKKQLKIALNIEGGWGEGVSSEYLWMNGFYGGW